MTNFWLFCLRHREGCARIRSSLYSLTAVTAGDSLETLAVRSTNTQNPCVDNAVPLWGEQSLMTENTGLLHTQKINRFNEVASNAFGNDKTRGK